MGGAERITQALLEDLPAHGIACQLVCLRQLGPIGEQLAAAGVECEWELTTGSRDPRGIARVRELAKSFRADLLYILDHSNALFHGRIAARWLGIPAVVAVHRTGRADGTRSLSFVDRLLLPWTSCVIAVSEGHAAYLRDVEGVPAAKLRSIYNGVDVERFRDLDREEARRALGLSSSARVLCQVAALRPEKNHALTLSALATLPADERPQLLVVGDGAERAAIERDVARRGLAPWVRMLGQRDDIPLVLAASDLLVLSSHPRVETFPVCVLEAMAASLPVLATDVGSLREMVSDPDTARLIPPGEVVAFAAAMRELLADVELRQKMGAAARQRVERNFTRASMVERTAELLHELVGR